jgi:H/ACA ribonucleoprotein complex subunit 4
MATVRLSEEPAKIGVEPSKRTLAQLLAVGYVAIDKPVGPSSHEVAAYARSILRTAKVGHTGTLDPNVSGVLVVLLNDSCKAAAYLSETDKEYVCVMQTGRIHTREEIDKAFSLFHGKIYQTPPLESAVAKKLRIRTIHSLDVFEVEGRRVLFSCRCEAGTYIRTLCVDVGRVLGSGAEMAELRRTMAMGINEKECVTLQKLSDAQWLFSEKQDEKALRSHIRPLEDLAKLKRAAVLDAYIPKMLKGQDVPTAQLATLDDDIRKDEFAALTTQKGELVAIARALSSARDMLGGEKEIAFDVERLVRTSV